MNVDLPGHFRHLVDIAAVLLGSDGRARSDDDLVLFNNPRRGCGTGADGTIRVDLSQVSAEVHRVLITDSTEAQGKSFGDAPPK